MEIRRKFFVDFRSVDDALQAKNSGLLGMFEDIACIHGNQCGEDIFTSDLRWLLVGYRVNIVRRPKYGEEVEVTTWSQSYRGVTATREFELRDEAGELIVVGWSNWARVNIRTMELVRLTDEAMASYQSEPERTNFDKAPRITEPEDHQSVTPVTIDWRWMDNNRHMHNSYYLDVAEHVVPAEVRSELAGCSFDVVYKKEIAGNSVVNCLFTQGEDSWTVTFRSEDMSVLHAIVVYHRGKAEAGVKASPVEEADDKAEARPKRRHRRLFSKSTLCE